MLFVVACWVRALNKFSARWPMPSPAQTKPSKEKPTTFFVVSASSERWYVCFQWLAKVTIKVSDSSCAQLLTRPEQVQTWRVAAPVINSYSHYLAKEKRRGARGHEVNWCDYLLNCYFDLHLLAAGIKASTSSNNSHSTPSQTFPSTRSNSNLFSYTNICLSFT